jgi:hypothetical protein
VGFSAALSMKKVMKVDEAPAAGQCGL